MSIINEALKKTEEHIQKNAIQESVKSDTKYSLKAYLLYSFIFVIGLLLSSLIFTGFNRKVKLLQVPDATKALMPEKELRTSKTPPAATPVALPAAQRRVLAQPIRPDNGNKNTSFWPEVRPAKHNQTAGNFVLNGIFYSDNDGYALVNNQIIRESDTVDGASVEKITENTVRLNNAGEIITLYTNR